MSLEDDKELSRLARGASPDGIIGAKTTLTYVHDGDPFMLPGSGRSYEPTGREVIVEVDEAVRFSGDGHATHRWNRLDLAEIVRQLEQNPRPEHRFGRGAGATSSMTDDPGRGGWVLQSGCSPNTQRRAVRRVVTA